METNFLQTLPPEMQAEVQKLLRHRKMAEAMQMQSMQGAGPTQVVGGYAVKNSPLQAISQVLTGYMGGKGLESSDKSIADVMGRANEAYTGEMGKITDIGHFDKAAAIARAMQSTNPRIQQQVPTMRMMYESEAGRDQARNFKEGDWARADERFELDTERFKTDTTYRQQQQNLLQQQIDDARKRNDAAEVARLAQIKQGWAQISLGRGRLDLDREYKDRLLDIKEKPGGGKPLPPAALKLQGDEIDAIQTARSIDADLGALEDQLTSGKLDLGLAKNLESRARNFLGASSENSRNFSSFQATLEKLRNDSLRLNKGVQTEGDAVRAWNELFENINDPGVVKQRLGEVRRINERAANLRKVQLDQIRGNYQLPPMDFGTIAPVTPALGGGGESDLPPGVRRVK